MKKLLIILLPFFALSCANKVPPQGGEKDKDPPVVIASSPEMFSTHFKGGEFTITFDELFDLDNIYSQLVVSPMLESKPKVKSNRNKLTVSFGEEGLKPNTTYNFNFGGAIKDHNEGNVLKNFSYVFSTGDFIDSLYIKGKIVDAFTKKPVENVAVMLYENLDDSVPLTSPPSYFDITDENGEYIIANIKEGIYRFFALEDQNQNYIYDQPSERIGFLYELIDLEPDSVYVYDVSIFQEDNQKQFVAQVKAEPFGFITIVMNKPFKAMSYKVLGRDPEHAGFKHKLWPGKDTLQFWFPDYEEEFTLVVYDINDFSDSIDVKIKPVFSLKEVPEFKIKSNVGNKMDLGVPLILQVMHPLETWNPTLLKLWEDSVQMEIEPYIVDSTKLTIRIDYPWKENKKYNLIVGLGAFTDMYDEKNNVYELKFGAQEERFYGVINLDISLFEKEWPFILELFNTDGVVLNSQQIYKSRHVVYPQLQPGDYGLRVIEDVNENGKWDPGNYEKGILPENLYYFYEMIKVRSNWEVEQSWNLPED